MILLLEILQQRRRDEMSIFTFAFLRPSGFFEVPLALPLWWDENPLFVNLLAGIICSLDLLFGRTLYHLDPARFGIGSWGIFGDLG